MPSDSPSVPGSTRPGPLAVLYQDDHIVAVSKPGGLLVHRSRESSDRVFLLQTLRDQIGNRIYPVHRLDRAASGVIVFALSSDDARLLQENLARAEVRKEYVTLVRGSTEDRFESRRPLTGANGIRKESWTEFEKIAEFAHCTLVRAFLHTGRRHQIRRHLHHLAHQIIGDSSYGKGRINQSFRDNHQLPRLVLHAHRLDVRHPSTGEFLELRAPLAEDLESFLLRIGCPRDVLEQLSGARS